MSLQEPEVRFQRFGASQKGRHVSDELVLSGIGFKFPEQDLVVPGRSAAIAT